jgi:pimeloyl-ACP methyl ester carboxylesterase
VANEQPLGTDPEHEPLGTAPTGTILFLHGLGATAGMWDGHARVLPEFRILAPDLPGHGTASKHPWVSLAETTAEVAALIEATPQRRAHVVGLSMGGAVAIELINTRPELIDRVIVDGAAAMRWRFAPLLVGVVWLASTVLHTLPFMWLVAQALSIKADRRPGYYREIRLVDSGSFRRAVRQALGVRLRNARVAGPVLLVAGGHVGLLAALLWSLALGCAAAAVLLVLRAPRAPAGPQSADGVEVTIRGPLSYAGPGSLGGTESALRR